MSMHYTLNGSQPDACAFESLKRVETLEYPEQFVHIFHIKAHSVISDEDHHLIWFLVRASYFDFGLRARPCEFSSIGNQVDERKPQHGTVSVAGGQCADFPYDIAALGFLPDLA
jgi:hypothetical protein